MMVDCGVTVSQLNDCLCSIPIFEENISALKLAHSAGAMNFILSDANQHYIAVILDHHNIASSFIAIETNFSHIEETPRDVSPSSTSVSSVEEREGEVLKRLRISPHQPIESPHKCTLCPQNLCKGQVFDQWRAQHCFTKVVYVGDGGGDFCPALRLHPADVLLCRKNFPLHKKCSRVTARQSPQSQLQANVVPWSSGKDILSFFQDIF